MRLNFMGIIVALCSFVVIGVFHPIVIKSEYYFTERIWPVFLAAGLGFLIAALFVEGLPSVVLGLLGTACLWSIGELKEQAKRVLKGWFPRNPRRK